MSFLSLGFRAQFAAKARCQSRILFCFLATIIEMSLIVLLVILVRFGYLQELLNIIVFVN